jgi:hypothetical protein
MPDAPQRVCPHCARISYESGARCPYCGRTFARRVLPALALMLLVFGAGILGGVGLMLTAFANTLDDRLDTQVRRVQDDFQRQLDGLQTNVQRELDRRLPEPTPTP